VLSSVKKHIRELPGRLRRPWSRLDKSATEATKAGDSAKAKGSDILGRFREIVSDPLNLLIERDPRAGMVENGLVWLHNGNRVPVEGRHAYYGRFSDVLVINRGVHEPLEEYVFQEVLRAMPDEPTMLELGAYWGHYSMWMKRARPRSRVFMVEPDARNLDAGRANFARHAFEGTFIRAFVGKGKFEVDRFMSEQGYPRLNILHSDIQGFEIEMLRGASESFSRGLIDFVFVSTHSQSLHDAVLAELSTAGMRIEASSGHAIETTSFDGFVLASRPVMPPVLPAFNPIGRVAILHSGPAELVSYLASQISHGTNSPHGSSLVRSVDDKS
jgi:hypothetical protein